MDDTSLSKLMIILDKLDLNIGNMQDYDFRLKLQKIVYLFEDLFKLDMGFSHSWYVRGPYCKELASAGYTLSESSPEKREELKNELNVSDKIAVKIEKAKSLLEPHLNDSNWLELAASIKYLKKYSLKPSSMAIIKSDLLGKKPEMARKIYNDLSFDNAFSQIYKFIIENEI